MTDLQGSRLLSEAHEIGLEITHDMKAWEVEALVAASTTIPRRISERARDLRISIPLGMTVGEVRAAIDAKGVELCAKLGLTEGQVIQLGADFYLIKWIRAGVPRLKELLQLEGNRFAHSEKASFSRGPQRLGGVVIVEGATIVD